jgi:biotin carboxyl carrier protein
MDEISYLQRLRENPGNEEVRSAFLNWLESKGDGRAEWIKLLKERTRLEGELQKTNRKIQEIDLQNWPQRQPGSEEWLDLVCPLSIRSPLVGIFYGTPGPDAAPFVSVGDSVTPETIVGKVEAMMVFNDVLAGVHGLITAVVVANGTFVEYDDLLFILGRPPRPIAGG